MAKRIHKTNANSNENSEKKYKITLFVACYVTLLAVLLILFVLLSEPIANNIKQYIENMEVDFSKVLLQILLGVVSAFFALSTSTAVVSIFKNHKRIKEAQENLKKFDRVSYSSLGDERLYLERQISELNAKLVSSETRWMEVYHLLLTAQERQAKGAVSGTISTSKFLERFGIDTSTIQIQNNLVFVLTPFHEDYNHAYDVISDTCKKIRLTAMRGDEDNIPKDVLQNIIKCIVKSRIIVANLNGRNPNVFYELGIAQALNKPTILLAYRDEPIPFDFKNQYLIFYKYDDELSAQLSDACLKILASNE